MFENLVWADEDDDPRPLRRLGVVSGSVVLAGVVLLLLEHRRGAHGLSGGGLVVVWLVLAVAALLLLGAVAGLLARLRSARRPRLDPQELHDRQTVRALLRRGREVPPELGGVAQRVVDGVRSRRWSPGLWVVLGVFWAGTSITYAGFDRWVHLVLGVGYLGMGVERLLRDRRLLRAGAALGFHPRARRRGARRGRGRS